MGKVTLTLPGANPSAVAGTQNIVASANPKPLTLKIFVDGVQRATVNNAGSLQYLWDTTGYANGSVHTLIATAAYKTGSDQTSLSVTVNNAGSGGGGGAGATLTMTFEGKIRDKVGQGESASADSAMDGVFKATLGGAARTLTAVTLGSSGWSWNTTAGDGVWGVSVNKNLDSALSALPMALTVGESFYLYASDYQNLLFTGGQTYRLTATFSDGTFATADAIVSAPSGNPSGVPMPTGDLPGWRWIFGDDFNTPVPLGGFSNCTALLTNYQNGTAYCSGTPQAVRDKWTAYNDGWIENGHQGGFTGYYYPSKVNSISGGMLDFWLHAENGQHLISAMVPKIRGSTTYPLGQLYGRYAVRMKASQMNGYKCSFLLWPDSGVWPRDGEIDYPECNFSASNPSAQYIYAFMHRQDGTWEGDQDYYASTTQMYDGNWHTLVMEWLPTRCTFILDDVVLGSSTSRIPNTSMFWALQTGTRGDGTSDSDQGHVQIDWVVAYAKI